MIGHEELLLRSVVSSHHAPRVQIPGHTYYSLSTRRHHRRLRCLHSQTSSSHLLCQYFSGVHFPCLKFSPQLYSSSMLINMMICPKNAVPNTFTRGFFNGTVEFDHQTLSHVEVETGPRTLPDGRVSLLELAMNSFRLRCTFAKRILPSPPFVILCLYQPCIFQNIPVVLYQGGERKTCRERRAAFEWLSTPNSALES